MSELRLCVKKLPSLSWKVSLSALEKLLMCIYAFDGPACLGDCLQACLPVSASNDEDDGGNQRGDGADVGASSP